MTHNLQEVCLYHSDQSDGVLTVTSRKIGDKRYRRSLVSEILITYLLFISYSLFVHLIFLESCLWLPNRIIRCSILSAFYYINILYVYSYDILLLLVLFYSQSGFMSLDGHHVMISDRGIIARKDHKDTAAGLNEDVTGTRDETGNAAISPILHTLHRRWKIHGERTCNTSSINFLFQNILVGNTIKTKYLIRTILQIFSFFS